MKLSSDRILTTHVGSLPRSKAVTDGVFAKENEQPYDPAALAATITEAVCAMARALATAILACFFSSYLNLGNNFLLRLRKVLTS